MLQMPDYGIWGLAIITQMLGHDKEFKPKCDMTDMYIR
jgi:hypothetical protein